MEEVVVYDYKTIKVKREMEALVCDTYQNLGWQLTGSSSTEGSLFYINLSFKRDRKIANKVELLKLQDRADNVIANIENLQNKKKNSGLVPALSTGIVGTLIFGGGMSMTMLLKGAQFMVGGIAIGLIGALVCVLAYPLFKKINKSSVAKIQPILESEYDKLADVCEQAGKLFNEKF